MNNPLIPQQRADKNGKLVTRHVKAMPTATGSAAGLPAPVAAPAKKAPKQKPVKPLERQIKNQQRMINREEFSSSPELRKALGIKDDAWRLAVIDASEVQLFDVFSVVSLDNAINLFEAEIRTSDEVLQFLNQHGLDDLVVDRREMMDKAVALRVNSFDLLDLHSGFGMDNFDEDTFIQAARVKGSNMLPYVNKDGAGPGTFHEGVLKGEINYDDLTTVTYSVLSTSTLTQEIYDGLKSIKDGSVDFDAEFLKHLVVHSVSNDETFAGALEMTKVQGTEFVGGIKGLGDASRISTEFKDRGADYCRSLIEFNEVYYDDFHDQFRSTSDAQRLHEARVDPSDAKHLKRQGMSIDQIISARQSGITGAVTGGWL
jgi:hypothetical protein